MGKVLGHSLKSCADLCPYPILRKPIRVTSSRFQVVASIPGGISFYYNVREGGGGVRKNLRTKRGLLHFVSLLVF